MPTRKPRKTARAAKSRKPVARRAPARAAASRKKAAPRSAAKSRAAAPRAPGPAAASAASREVVALKAKLEREKSGSEKRLTEMMREIATLRHHEARVAQLERQLKERDELIVQLRSQLNDLRNREVVTPDDELQPSLALGSRGHDFDEFDDDVGPEEDDDLI
ncbi:MAG TPA: hypothetical protein VGK30_18790 [Candidatus Binatia bacterium]|jgi:predicted RNase H-like nuclease (RuvC/YqgF family)